jgi:hypothetical protein
MWCFLLLVFPHKGAARIRSCNATSALYVLDVSEREIICQTFGYLIPTVDSIIEVVANLLRIVETGFIPGRIDHCAECDSDKMVFPKSRGRKKKNETAGIKGALLGMWLRG